MGQWPIFCWCEVQMAGTENKLRQLLTPAIEALGCEFWGVEYITGGRRKLLRLYIDRAGEGVGVADCERVSRQVSSILDVEDPIPGEYVLEVSSPGMDRPLYELAQFERFVGEEVAVKLRVPFEGQRNFKGILRGVENEDVVLVVSDQEYFFPVEGIEKANVVPRF